MGQLLDTLLAKSFRPVKCKSLLDQTILRTVQLKGQREIQLNIFKKDVAELLKKDQRASALSKVDDVFKEQNMIEVYVLIQGFCSDVIKKMLFIEKQKSCPNSIREAIASLCFAAQKCTELPELQQIRYIFSSKYGREFTAALPGVQSDFGVSKEMRHKLSARKPNGYMKVKLLKEIANENGIGWKLENFMDGSDSFTDAKKIDRASSVLENTDHVSELEKWPVHSQPLQPAPEISSLDDDRKKKTQNLISAKNGNGKLHDTENYDSQVHFVLENRKSSSVRTIRSGELGSSEKEQKTSPWVEDKSVQNKGKRTRNCNEDQLESPTGNDCNNSSRYSRADEFYVEYKGVKIRYTDVAIAAHEALDSAEHAAMAARAALTLAIREYNQNSSQTTNESSEISSGSSDEDEAFERIFLRDRNEQRNSKQSRELTRCGSKCSEQQRGTYGHSDIEYQSIGNDVPERKKAQAGREASPNKPITWAKPRSNNQSSPSTFNHPHTILNGLKSGRSGPLLERRQNQDPSRVPNRCMSERRLRPRMSFADEAETEKSQSSRLSNAMQSEDFESIKFKYRSKTPVPRKSEPLDDSYQGIATANKFIVSQNSRKEELRKYEGSGKLRWYSTNLQDQETHFISIDEIGSINSYNNVGNDGEIRSYMSGEFSTELEVNQSIHGHQEKISWSKNVLDSRDKGLKGNKEDCGRIDLDRLPKSLRSWRMQFPSKPDE